MARTTPVKTLSLLVLISGLADSATAQEVETAAAIATGDEVLEEESAEFDRWALSLSAGFDVLMQGVSGSLSTNFVQYDPKVPTSAAGTEFFVNPMFGFGTELRSPAPFVNLPGRPRLYVGATLRYAQRLPHTIAQAGSKPFPIPPEGEFFSFETFKNEVRGESFPTYPQPGDPDFPGYDGNTVNTLCEGSCAPEFVGGQGSAVTASYDHFYWQVELGVVFQIPLEERSLLIKPAVGYFQQQFNLDGQAHRVYRDETTRAFSTAELDSAIKETFGAVGPKIMVELETGGFSWLDQDFMPSLFFDGGVFWTVGNRRVDWHAEALVPGDFPDGPAPDRDPHQPLQTADYHFELDKMSYRLGVGFRLSWHPKW